jgi:small conductance mechanosensitive channel
MTRRLIDIATILILAYTLASVFTPAYAEASNQGEQTRTYAQFLEEIAFEQQRISELAKRLPREKGILQAAIDSRLTRARITLLDLNLAFLNYVVESEKAGNQNDTHRQQAIKIYEAQLQDLSTTEQAIRKQVLPGEELVTAAETAAFNSRLFEHTDRLNRVYEIAIASQALAPQFGIDNTAETEKLRQKMYDRAENASILLEMATSDMTALRAIIAALPDDTEAKARLKVVTAHISNLANAMTKILGMMKGLGMNTDQYQNQLLAATGQITTEIFEFGVFTNLLIGWSETLWGQVIESGPGLVFNLILLMIIIYTFYKLAGVAQKLTESGLDDSRFQLSLLLKRMVVSIVRNTVLVIGVLIGLSQIGISLGPLLAGMGLVGFVVGFALQDTLSNFAAGMLILIYRPFDVDDVIEAGGVSGLVSKMSLVNTTFLTFDNQTIIVPNGKIWGDVIKNVTAQTIRRIDLVFGIAYSDDIEKAEKVMAEVVAANPAVLDDPPTMIRLHELGDSSVNYVVRPWVNKDDYWETFWALNRAMKIRFDEEGISIPFPQRDVHLFKEQSIG